MKTRTLNGPPGLLIGEKSRLGSESKSERHKSTSDWSTLNGSPGLLIGETVEPPKEFQTKAKIADQSTLNGPPGLLIGEMVESTGEQREESSEPSWREAAQRKL